ncbi:MAG: hypothetical protein GF346_05895 [Candidatus Eisenbacteria bacterium]|nr:hypothetical protein [Candidatus Latescibacterota bacterium]MBD3301961.1 hypothetical protein [Candidatus Eisenbacteria bacterium]
MNQRGRRCIGILLAGILLAVVPAAAAPQASPPRLLLAEEDTLDLTGIWEIDPLEVRADRLRIGDIVQRCIEQEEALREKIEAHRYTQSLKTVLHVGGYGEEADRLLVFEEVDRVTTDREGVRSVALHRDRYVLEDGERRPPDEEEEDENSSVGVSFGDINELPFYLEDESAYDFEIRSRRIAGNHVIYEVRFVPKSDFEIAPQGTIWIDTADFRILREEFDFGDRVPMPLLIRSLGPVIRERERIGDLWVWKRILVRVDLRIGWMRFVEKDIPDTVEFIADFTDHDLNEEVE